MEIMLILYAFIDETDALLCLSLSVLLFIGAQHAKYYHEQWFRDAMARWCKDLFTHGGITGTDG